MLKAYKKALLDQHADLGSWAAVGRQIGHDLENIDS
jgi:hypothetical protein